MPIALREEHVALQASVRRCLTIAGGTSEVQRNVIAERLLGLPRDVGRPDRTSS
jgi:alkylation response protein AidB-like acyl-CoA dehydrogenase